MSIKFSPDQELTWKEVRQWLNAQAPMLSTLLLREAFKVSPKLGVYSEFTPAVVMVDYLRHMILHTKPLTEPSGFKLSDLEDLRKVRASEGDPG